VISCASQLRQELNAQNVEYARSRGLSHVSSYGENAVVVYEPRNRSHGNFLDVSYRAILRNPAWARRLGKIHTSAAHHLPKADHRWRELDSCMSSDALLMNVFCHPRCLDSVGFMLGVQRRESPVFGFRARVPLANGRSDRTEVDMKVGSLLVESKLTESDFQTKAADVVEGYRDFRDVFDRRMLPKLRKQYASYQLIRNVLAAHALGLSFCVILDARRPDLIEAWYAVMRCVRMAELRTRCQVLTWQELSENLPLHLRLFLRNKYAVNSMRVWNSCVLALRHR
jgi:hypothetical protein